METNTLTPPAALWTITELAAFLGYKPTTLASMVSRTPDRLPPRVAALGLARWNPATVYAWVERQSLPGRGGASVVAAPRKGGRPRKSA